MESNLFICRANQWTGFYKTKTFVMKELMLWYLYVLIEIYASITTMYSTSMHPNIQGECF